MQLHDGRLSLQRFDRAAGPSLSVDVDLDELGRFGHMDILGHGLAVAAYLDAVRARKQRDMGCPIAIRRDGLDGLVVLRDNEIRSYISILIHRCSRM